MGKVFILRGILNFKNLEIKRELIFNQFPFFFLRCELLMH